MLLESQTNMKLLIIVINKNLPSSRIRFVQIKTHLEDLGLSVDIVEYPKRFSGFFRLLGRIRTADMVILQKQLPNPPETLLIRLSAKRLIFDYDDAIRFRDLPRDGSYRSRSREIRFDTVIACAHGVTCGNAYLAGLMRRRKPVHLYPSPVPTNVPVKDYRTRSEGIFKFGWVGLGVNLISLELIIPGLQKLAGENTFELVVISDRDLIIDGVRVVNRTWNLADQEKWISELDIGLMPLDTESPFEKGKCSYKLLQYMASGVIPVAGAVGMNETVIQDGVNGRLVYDSDWYPVLKTMLELSTEEKAALGQRARETVLKDYDYPGQVEKLFQFIRQVAGN